MKALSKFFEDSGVHTVEHEHQHRPETPERCDDASKAVFDRHNSLAAGAGQPFADAGSEYPVPLLASRTHGAMNFAEQRSDLGVFVTAKQLTPRLVFEGALHGVVRHEASRSARRLAP